MNITPPDAFLQLIDHLERDEEPPAPLKSWYLSGLKAYRSGTARTLDEALGLAVGPGQAREKPCYVWRTRQRDQLIKEAAGHLLKHVGKTKAAGIIADSMADAVPNVKDHQATIALIKLRNVCIDGGGDPALAIGWRRALEIINGDGFR
ncbi:hypothetical protein C8D92_102228 [Tamilnaduibacter salinus]|uniref:Uncharacterized protein n=1 Tax=Tamilnaduibacter salinus TaxID=1484056 RepID=A0A2U1CZG8_9GAMM|nr:hypothetical protein [Tamilnaduibacter salinus]PVY78188.1 hypothetical protein C8D92_102228 [Tamilnaduibacter salinus]